MSYDPTSAPASYDQVWMRTELNKIREAMFSPKPFEYLQEQHVAPPKPRDGMVVLADGVDWNPGAGPGYYGYYGGRWVLLSGQRFANCRLDGGVAANSIKLSRHGGNLLTVGGQTLEIPANGIEVVPTGVTAGLIYYVYAYNNAGTLALEYNTTAHITHTDGTEIKSGDSSRLLVGMFRPTTGAVIRDGSTGRCVASWFNRAPKSVFNVNSSMATASTSPIPGLSVPDLLCWAGNFTSARFSGNGSNTNNLGQSVVRPYLDTVAQETSFVLQPSTATQQLNFSFNAAAMVSTDKNCSWALYVWVNSGQLTASAIVNAEADI